MIYEVRTYHITPHKVPEVMKRFGEAYEERAKISPMLGFFYTDIGPLNQIIHIWPYEDIEERARVRVEAAKLPNWPPSISEFAEDMTAEIFIPFSFMPPMAPGKHGPIYELRSYIIKPGEMPGMAIPGDMVGTGSQPVPPAASAPRTVHGHCTVPERGVPGPLL